MTSVFFQVQLGLSALAGVNVWRFHRRLYPTVDAWGAAPTPPRHARQARIDAVAAPPRTSSR
jgi:hypothetical protein